MKRLKTPKFCYCSHFILIYIQQTWIHSLNMYMCLRIYHTNGTKSLQTTITTAGFNLKRYNLTQYLSIKFKQYATKLSKSQQYILIFLVK